MNNFSIIAKPLYELLRKNVEFHLGVEENKAFETLKQCLADEPVLGIFDPLFRTKLHCDASANGFGAILLQTQPNGPLRPIFYFSKRTTAPESKIIASNLSV